MTNNGLVWYNDYIPNGKFGAGAPLKKDVKQMKKMLWEGLKDTFSTMILFMVIAVPALVILDTFTMHPQEVNMNAPFVLSQTSDHYMLIGKNGKVLETGRGRLELDITHNDSRKEGIYKCGFGYEYNVTENKTAPLYFLNQREMVVKISDDDGMILRRTSPAKVIHIPGDNVLFGHSYTSYVWEWGYNQTPKEGKLVKYEYSI